MSSNGKMSVCEGCQTEHENKYTYGKCKWCEEKVCGWCSYDTKTGITCLKCGFSLRRLTARDDGMMWCDKRKKYIPTPAECELLAEGIKNCPYEYTFTPEVFAPKKKVKLVVVKRLPPKDLMTAVLEEYRDLADFEMRHRVWQKKVDTMTCDYCHQKRALMEERKPVDGVPTELVCMDCRVSK